MKKLDQLKAGDILVLAGSIPSSMPASTYEDVLARLQDRKILTVVDATKNLLTNVLKYHPFLIKPNNHELGELFCLEFNTHEEVIPYAKELQKQGARNVLVSMGGKGAALVAENGEVYTSDAVKGRLVNAVGAGDSMVAGFLTGWLEQHDYAHAFAWLLRLQLPVPFLNYWLPKTKLWRFMINYRYKKGGTLPPFFNLPQMSSLHTQLVFHPQSPLRYPRRWGLSVSQFPVPVSEHLPERLSV